MCKISMFQSYFDWRPIFGHGEISPIFGPCVGHFGDIYPSLFSFHDSYLSLLLFIRECCFTG